MPAEISGNPLPRNRLVAVDLSRPVLWACLLALFYLAFVRWMSTNAGHFHPDEIIAVSVVDSMRERGDLNTNWELAPLPAEFRYPQFNFSGYHLAIHVVEAARCIRLLEADCRTTRLEALRALSVVASVLVVWFSYLLARIKLEPGSALFAAAATGLSVQLFQDATVARPEAFCTVIFLAVLLLLFGDRLTTPRIVGAAVLTGFLLGTKVSFAPLAALVPIVVLARGQLEIGLLARARISVFVALSGVLAGFALATPYAVVDSSAFANGVEYLQAQYKSGHWPHGVPEASIDLRLWHGIRYLNATLGPVILVLALVACFAARDRRAIFTTTLALLCAFYVVFFSTRSAFFERNFSHVLPLVCILAAYGAQALSPTVQRWSPRVRTGLIGIVVLGALAPGAYWSYVLYTVSVQGSYAAVIENQVQVTSASCDCLRTEPISAQDDWRALRAWRSAQPRADQRVLIAFLDFGDSRSERQLATLTASSGVEAADHIRSPFALIPLSSFHVYHGPDVRLFIAKPGVVTLRN